MKTAKPTRGETVTVALERAHRAGELRVPGGGGRRARRAVAERVWASGSCSYMFKCHIRAQ